MATNEGASSKEILFEACRRDNISLLEGILATPPYSSSVTETATFLNTATNSLGAGPLHVAATYGSYDVLDLILDQEGVEIDGKEKRDGDTALHCAARYCNGLAQEQWPTQGKAVIEILLDAGLDPRIRNKAKRKALELVDPRNDACRDVLRRAEMTLMAGDDIVREDVDDRIADAGSESE